MKIFLAGLLAAMTLALFSQTAIQAAGDIWPDGGSLPRVIQLAGDIWPDGG